VGVVPPGKRPGLARTIAVAPAGALAYAAGVADPVPDDLATSPAAIPAGQSRWRRWRARLIIGAVVVVLGIMGTLGFMTARWVDSLTGKDRPSSRTVIVAIQQLARLEGAEYHMERVVDLKDKQTRFFGLIETEDAVLMVAAGSVIAGTDLNALAEDAVDMNADRTSVSVSLPRSRVLVSRLDNERTYVYERRTDLLAERKEGLEARAREEAERTLVQAATEAGLLERSDASIRRTVESLLRSLGFDEVQVELR
jgi:hypothetical protein